MTSVKSSVLVALLGALALPLGGCVAETEPNDPAPTYTRANTPGGGGSGSENAARNDMPGTTSQPKAFVFCPQPVPVPWNEQDNGGGVGPLPEPSTSPAGPKRVGDSTQDQIDDVPVGPHGGFHTNVHGRATAE